MPIADHYKEGSIRCVDELRSNEALFDRFFLLRVAMNKEMNKQRKKT